MKTFKQYINKNLNEAQIREFEYEDLVSDVNDAFNEIKTTCDKINKRFHYRLMINRS